MDRLFPLPTIAPHPARFTPAILDEIRHLLDLHRIFEPGTAPQPGQLCRVLDPFAGVGGIHALAERDRIFTIGVELEPEWARADRRSLVGDATRLPLRDASVDAVCTSPAYGNRMADAYDGRDGSVRHTYRISLGRELTPNSGAALQWGEDYRALHTEAWREALRVLRPGRPFVLNCSDHIRLGVVQLVSDWHLETLEALGAEWEMTVGVPTPRVRHGANSDARPATEHVHLLTKKPVHLLTNIHREPRW